ncbi:protein kinase C delta type-like [Aquarana catesbeiana]|uniref:protein kinase C delta type-like n=1 Tax=Aquarana catesbeiana TaxID=8400 RepID=UPI003CC96305
MLATNCDSGKLVALKIVEKMGLIGYDQDTIMTERQVMQMVMGHPYCTKLYATFQSQDHLFYVMEFFSGGDLRKQIKSKKCDLSTMRRLAAELLCGLQFVHSKGILHGDVIPENILLDCNGHVRLADFGNAETNMFGAEMRTGEFGTELYIAPETLTQ